MRCLDFGNEGKDLGGDLAVLAGPPTLGDQCLQTTFTEGPFGTHAGGHRGAETAGDVPHRAAGSSADHLIADLEEITSVEEFAVVEQQVCDLFRVGADGQVG